MKCSITGKKTQEETKPRHKHLRLCFVSCALAFSALRFMPFHAAMNSGHSIVSCFFLAAHSQRTYAETLSLVFFFCGTDKGRPRADKAVPLEVPSSPEESHQASLLCWRRIMSLMRTISLMLVGSVAARELPGLLHNFALQCPASTTGPINPSCCYLCVYLHAFMHTLRFGIFKNALKQQICYLLTNKKSKAS